MRSRMIWLVACAAVSAVAACSDDDSATDPTTAGLPAQPGAGGSSSSVDPSAPPLVAAGTGGSATEGTPTPPRATGNAGAASGSNAAGAADADAGVTGPALTDAGAAPPRPDAAVNPPPGNPPPAGDAVGFSDVFQLLLDSCGNCHGANAPGGRPRFAQAGNEAASFAATQGMAAGARVSTRIIARAVTARNMPPACGGRMLGTNGCLDVAEAAQLQAWLDQGAQP
jgi:hypothetical protein